MHGELGGQSCPTSILRAASLPPFLVVFFREEIIEIC